MTVSKVFKILSISSRILLLLHFLFSLPQIILIENKKQEFVTISSLNIANVSTITFRNGKTPDLKRANVKDQLFSHTGIAYTGQFNIGLQIISEVFQNYVKSCSHQLYARGPPTV